MIGLKSGLYLVSLVVFLNLFLQFHQVSFFFLASVPALLLLGAGLLFCLGQFRLPVIVRSFAQAAGFARAAIAPQTAREVLATLGRYTLMMGLVGTVMCVITLLTALDDWQALSHSLAVSLMYLLDALILRFLILYPLEQSLLQQELQQDLQERSPA